MGFIPESTARLAVALVTCSILLGGASEEVQLSDCALGNSGGQLVIGLRAEPRTLNPVLALDAGSRELISLLTADLIHVDRGLFQPVPALAKSWTVANGGRQYTLHLRKGLRFSDGHSFDADDVLFTFQVHLDERVNSPQREMLTVGGRPITVRKIDSETVEFNLARPYAGAERLFDGIGVLPKHLLQQAYAAGQMGSIWSLAAPPEQIAGLGPFRLKEYVPGQRIVLERNPYYWKIDRRQKRLPYLDEIVFLFVGSEDAQVLRFESGETQAIAGLNAGNFAVLKREQENRRLRLLDAGPGLEYSFLLLNQNDPGPASDPNVLDRQKWFRNVGFRQALSMTIDRDAIVRLTYGGLASPLWGPVADGNRMWLNRALPRPPRSPERARELLKQAGFSWNSSRQLLDSTNTPVEFSILTSSGNSQRAQIATIIQEDLHEIGINSSIVSLEFRTMVDKIFESHDYDTAVMTLASGDTDPNAEMNVLVSRGNTRVWNLTGAATTRWEQEIDQLMRVQMETPDFAARKRYYDRVQELMASNQPMIYLVSPHLLAGASARLGNVQPSILSPNILWNAEQLYFQPKVSGGRWN